LLGLHKIAIYLVIRYVGSFETQKSGLIAAIEAMPPETIEPVWM
jgi:hypothetical protein